MPLIPRPTTLQALLALLLAGCFGDDKEEPAPGGGSDTAEDSTPGDDTGTTGDGPDTGDDTGDTHDTDTDDTGDSGDTDTGGEVIACASAEVELVWYEGDVQGAGAIASFCDDYNAIDGDLIIDVPGLTDLRDLDCLVQVTGAVTLTHDLALSSLDGLDSLEHVGSLTVEVNESMEALSGAPRLRTVEDDLVLNGYSRWDSALTSADGFECLEEIGDRLEIRNHDELLEIDTFPSLRSVSWILISHSESLQRVAGFPVLETVNHLEIGEMGGPEEIEGFPLVRSIGFLKLRLVGAASLTGLEALESVDGYAEIATFAGAGTLGGLRSLREARELRIYLHNYYESSIHDLGELSSLESVGTLVLDVDRLDEVNLPALHSLDGLEIDLGAYDLGYFSLDGLEWVRSLPEGLSITAYSGQPCDLSALSSLEEVGADLRLVGGSFVGDLESLVTVDGDLEIDEHSGATLPSLMALETVTGDLSITDSDATNGDLLPALSAVGGALQVSDNPALTELSLPSLVALGGGLQVSDNLAATALSIPWLTRIGGDLLLQDNVAMTSADLGAVEELDGGFTAHWNTELESLDLGSLTTTAGDLVLSRNRDLSSLDLGALTEVGGSLRLLSNYPGLRNLDGLSALSTITGDLELDDNRRLNDVTGLHGVDSVAGDLLITDNTALPTASAEALRDAIPSISGSATISGNGP